MSTEAQSVYDFRNGFLQDVHLDSEQNDSNPKEEFLNKYVQILIDAEEFTDFNLLQYESTGSRNARLQLDGYYYDELEDCLGLFLCQFDDSPQPKTLNVTDSKTLFGRMKNFVRDSRNGFILKNGEESSAGYGLAYDISKRYSTVSKFKFYILTDMIMSSRIKDIQGATLEDAETEYFIWDITRLQGLIESKSGKEDIVINLEDFGVDGIPCLEASKGDDYTAYLCNIPGKVLADIYNKYGGRLLEGNVRSFLTAKGKVNKGIRNTILNEPGKFFAYNNGIAATAYNISTQPGTHSLLITEITGLQIVNGGQTTASLANAIIVDKTRANNLENIFVPMKLSVVDPEDAAVLIPEISRYANSQNKVSEADFFSNSPFHIRMEEISRRLLAPAVNGNQYRTHWYYERTRGQYKQDQAKMTKSAKDKFRMENPPKQVITKTDLSKYYNLYQMKPDKVSLGAQKNFIQFANWAADEWKNHEAVFNDEFYTKIICLDILFKTIDDIVRHAPWYNSGYKAQIDAYTMGWLFYLIKEEHPGYVLNFKDIWLKQSVSAHLRTQLQELSRIVNDTLLDQSRGVDNVTEWAKRAACWDGLKDKKVGLTPEFVSELIPEELEKERNKAAEKEQKEINKATALIDVYNYGTANWKKVMDWGIANHIFNDRDISFLKIASTSGKVPSDKQAVKIMEVLQKAKEESYPD